MVSLKKLEEIGKEVAEKISRCPKVEAVAFIGSLATGFVDRFTNDVDLICICKDFPTVEERRKYLGKQNYRKNLESKYIEIFNLGKVEIDISFRPIRWLEDALKKDPYDENAEKYNLSLIQSMKPIIDKKNIIKKLKRKARYTQEYRKKKIEFCFSVLTHTQKINEKLLKRNETPFLCYRFPLLLEKYANIIFALNKKYFSDLKWIDKYLAKFKIKPKNALYYIRRISELGNRKKELEEKIKLLKKMVKELALTVKKEIPEAKIEESLEELM